MEEKTVTLMTSTYVDDGRGRIALMFNFYRKGEFRGTYLKWFNSINCLDSFLEGLTFLEPAKYISFSDFGIDKRFSDYRILNQNRPVMIIDFVKKLKNMIGRIKTKDSFIEKNKYAGMDFQFQTEYDGINLFDITDDNWHLAERKPVLQGMRKKKRIIF